MLKRFRRVDVVETSLTVFLVCLLGVLAIACVCGAVGLVRWTFFS
jgi:hypothetical protein